MKKFQGGEFMDGNVALNDYFDDNIFLYFENPRISSYQHFEQKKEEYKMAVEHTSLKKVGLSLQTFHMEASSKLLEDRGDLEVVPTESPRDGSAVLFVVQGEVNDSNWGEQAALHFRGRCAGESSCL